MKSILCKKLLVGASFLLAGINANAQQWVDVASTGSISTGGASYVNLVADNSGKYFVSYYDASAIKETCNNITVQHGLTLELLQG
ncbi:hypothetical protein [Chryseobacterium sp.]|uniref:hypothetical protein n=1 Tax=Chryseobacterium sp. TaxID=1871047 RepID=UPI0028A186FB|nr:hypothetical protein [Chryseobacterium sp.]